MTTQPLPFPFAIHSIAGTKYTNTVGYVPNFLDPIWICKSGIANILSIAKVFEDGCDITYDQNADATWCKTDSFHQLSLSYNWTLWASGTISRSVPHKYRGLPHKWKCSLEDCLFQICSSGNEHDGYLNT